MSFITAGEKCNEVSVDRTTATWTQTLKSVREGRRSGQRPKEKRTQTGQTNRNSGTLPRPEGDLFQRPYRNQVQSGRLALYPVIDIFKMKPLVRPLGVDLVAIKPSNQNYNLSFGVCSVIVRLSLARRPAPTSQARKMVQHALKVSPGGQL
jgi:hypothetical protein